MINHFLLSPSIKDPDLQPFEVVERKGIGHPDTIADGIAENFSIEFSKFCLSEFGIILNHWVDKTLLTGGLSEVGFGKARLVKPINLYFFGKMSKSFAGNPIDIQRIAYNTTKKYLSTALPTLDIKKDLVINFPMNDYSRNPRWMNPFSKDDLPNAVDPRSNDSSVGMGFWPLSKTEQLVLSLEKFFYNDQRKVFSYIGSDIKILAVRTGMHINITMCVPFIPIDIADEDMYQDLKKGLFDELHSYSSAFLGEKYTLELNINNEDTSMDKGALSKRKGHYFLVTGSALDDGEVGVVGRGNPASGVISCYRPHSMEAPYGKNPVYHVGKVYTYLAHKLAREISETFNCSISVSLSSRMGDKLNNPYQAVVESSIPLKKALVANLIEEEISRDQWTQEILTSRFFVPTPGNNI